MFLLLVAASSNDTLQSAVGAAIQHLNACSDAQSLLQFLQESAARKGTHRLAAFVFVAETGRSLQSVLQNFLDNAELRAANCRYGQTRFTADSTIVFCFPGMGTDVWRLASVDNPFSIRSQASIVEESLAAVQTALGVDILPLLDSLRDEQHFKSLCCAQLQPLIFAVQYALASLWQSFGVVPNKISTGSLGEISGAFWSKQLSLEKCCQLTAVSGRGHDLALDQGTMLVVIGLSLDDLCIVAQQFDVDVGAIIGVNLNCLSGDRARIQLAREALEKQNVVLVDPAVRVPFHSRLFRPHKDVLEQQLNDVLRSTEPATKKKPWISSISGAPVTAEQVRSSAFWLELFVGPAKSFQVMQHLNDAHVMIEMNTRVLYGRTFLEVQQAAGRLSEELLALATLDRMEPEQQELSEIEQFLGTICELFVNGVDSIDFVKAVNAATVLKN